MKTVTRKNKTFIIIIIIKVSFLGNNTVIAQFKTFNSDLIYSLKSRSMIFFTLNTRSNACSILQNVNLTCLFAERELK